MNIEDIDTNKIEEMLSKFFADSYNNDRYLRYSTYHPNSQMKTMGAYFTNSLYSYKIDPIPKSKKNWKSMALVNAKDSSKTDEQSFNDRYR